MGDSTQSAPSTIGESTIQQTGVTRKQGSLLGCEKHLLKLLSPLGTVSCLIIPKHRQPQVANKAGNVSSFNTLQCLPATLSGPWDSWQQASVYQYQGKLGMATADNYRLSGLCKVELSPGPKAAPTKQKEKLHPEGD